MTIDRDPLWVKVVNKVRTWARLNSIWAVHFNSGSCNGCDIEILATLTPLLQEGVVSAEDWRRLTRQLGLA